MTIAKPAFFFSLFCAISEHWEISQWLDAFLRQNLLGRGSLLGRDAERSMVFGGGPIPNQPHLRKKKCLGFLVIS